MMASLEPRWIAIWVAAGCSAGRSAPPSVRYDTLPSGIVSISNESPSGWSDTARSWHFREVARFGGADGSSGELVEPSNMAVDAQGRVYVADRKPPSVKVFDSTGALVRVIGREGSGPGEFRVAFIAVRDSVLVIHDPMQSRTSVFDTSGTFRRSWVSACCYWTEIMVDRALIIYIPAPTPPDSTGKNVGRAFLRYRVDGTALDTVVVPVTIDESKAWTVTSKDKKMQMSTGIPFVPTTEIVIHPAGGFVTAFTNAYRLAVLRGKDTARIITRPWTPEPIPDAHRQARTREVIKWVSESYGEAAARDAIHLADVPTSYPAFASIRIGEDDHLWVRRFLGSDSTRTSYDVFSPGGAWLGAVTVPVGVPEWGSQFFGRDAVYAATEDDDGRPVIVKLVIVR